ncbi:MAG: hypothetical protein IM638_07710 [Bacteroidetes bacterium]|nr:hypothetical protein [Bacteroidota bacterium]
MQLAALHTGKSSASLTDNRTASNALRNLFQAKWDQVSMEKSIGSARSVSDGTPVQLVSYTNLWTTEKSKYQSGKVGSERLDGDAEWLAIVRFCKDVVKNSTDTVNDVIAKAEQKKGVSFANWKGSQSTGTGQEAQHLVSASYATKILRWPYEFINSEDNGKMLLAGRGGTQVNTNPQYTTAKQQSGKQPARGLFHIVKGVAHNAYDKHLKAYVTQYYQQHGLTIGQDIPYVHKKAITDYLRAKHKEFDGVPNPNSLGVDNLDLTTPVAIKQAPLAAKPVKTNSPTVPASVGVLGGAAGLAAGLKLATLAGYGALGATALATGGTVLGGLAAYYLTKKLIG